MGQSPRKRVPALGRNSAHIVRPRSGGYLVSLEDGEDSLVRWSPSGAVPLPGRSFAPLAQLELVEHPVCIGWVVTEGG